MILNSKNITKNLHFEIDEDIIKQGLSLYEELSQFKLHG